MLYLALVWNDAHPEGCESAHRLLRGFQVRSSGWQTVIEQPGLSVCCRTRTGSRLDATYPLHGNRGVVLGKLFDRSYTERRDSHQAAPAPGVLNESRSVAIIANAGRELIEHYWGQYVAFLRDGPARRTWVLRDPSGGVPCQWTRVFGIDVYFVRLEDCERLAPLTLSINRHYLLGYLLLSSSCIRETTFNEVETVLPGERIEHLADSRTHTFAWNPLAIAGRDVIEDEAEAVEATRRIVRAAVHAWASCFDGILLSLSGGLDSSIVASCLADAPTKPRVLCRNFYFAGPNSDERVFARQSAERAGFELIEQEAKADFRPQAIHHVLRSHFPVSWPVDPDEDRADDQFLESCGLSAEFRGHGGDEIFFRGGSFPTAVDYAWLHRPRRAVLSIALDDAALNRASVWRILRRVYRFGVRKRPWHPHDAVDTSHMPLIPASLRNEARADRSFRHPLYRDSANVPPGKFEHAYLLTYGTCTAYDPLLADERAARVSPLISQPLIELSLRTPLYVLRSGGRDRAIARRAFSRDVPAAIISRKSKAFGTHRHRVIIERNIDAVRELLLDGFLVGAGLLDRAKLEEVLSDRVSRIPSQTSELCDYLSVEAWARAWSEAPHQAPGTETGDATTARTYCEAGT